MKRRCDWKAILGTLLAGALAVGCVAPVIYYAYKGFESEDLVGIAVSINQPAAEVYDLSIQQIEKANNYKIVKRDDKTMTLSLEKIGNEKIKATVTVTALSPRSCRFAAVGAKEPGVDPAIQKRDALNSVLTLCTALGRECTPEQEPKK